MPSVSSSVGQAVAVGVDDLRVVGAVAGVGIGLAGVDHAVEVRVLEPSLTPPSSVSGSSGLVVVAPRRRRRRSAPAPTSVAGFVAVVAELGAVEQAVVVAVGVERVDQAVAVGVVAGVRLLAVEHAVVVGVGVVRVGAEVVLERRR